jgi:hypothetical protein
MRAERKVIDKIVDGKLGAGAVFEALGLLAAAGSRSILRRWLSAHPI